MRIAPSAAPNALPNPVVRRTQVPALRRMEQERGAVTLLVIGYCVLALAVIAVVTAATALYLERKQLYTLADGAALHAAEAFDLGTVQLLPSAAGARPRLQAELEPARVRAAARQFIADSDTARFDSLELVDATTHDLHSTVVTLRSAWRPPILAFLLPEGIPIEVTARARTVFD